MTAWHWETFTGSAAALKFARRDLPILERVITACVQHRVAVQAGGNLGIFPRRLAERFDTVYTFEPSPACFPHLIRNAPAENIVRLQVALGAEPGFVAMSQTRHEGRKPGLLHEGITHVAGPGPIPQLALDVLALPICDLLYLDLEGYEREALRGAEQTIARCRPVLAVEVNANALAYGVTEAEMEAALIALGYRHGWDAQSDQVWFPQEWAA